MDSKSNRNIKNINLIVRIKYKKEISGIIYDKEDDLVLYQRETLEEAFKRYITKNDIRIYKNQLFDFYLIKGKKYVLLDKKIKIMELDLNSGDKIEVQSPNNNLETNSDIIITDIPFKSEENRISDKYNLEQKEIIYQKNDVLTENNKKKCPLKLKIFIGVIILITIGLLLYFFIPRHNNSDYEYETFVTGLTYKEYQIMRFQNIKTTKILYDFGSITETNTSKTIKEYFDFVIGINEMNKVVENNIVKELFQGFIFLENYMLDNGTSKMLLQNSSLFDHIWPEKKSRRLLGINNKKYFNYSLDEISPYCCIDNGTLPIMKFVFYRNGEIKRIFKPKSLTTLLYNSMNEVLEKIIPKITKEYFNTTYNNFSNAIETEYEKIKKNELKEEDEDEELYDEDMEDEDNESEFDENITNNEMIRILNIKEEKDSENEEEIKNKRFLRKNKQRKSKLVKIIKLNKRKLQKNDTNDSNTFENSLDYEDIEEIIEQEYNGENDFSVNLFNNELTKDSSNNKTNLNYYSHSKIRNDFAEFKGSQQNTTSNSIIDETEKALKEIHYFVQGSLINNTNFEEDLEEERKKLCLNENFLDCNDLISDTEENIINSNINGLDYEIIENIISTGNFIDKNKKVINILEDIYKKYENSSEIIQINQKNKNSGQRLLRHLTDYVLDNKFDFPDAEIQIGKINEKRRLDEYSTYYGMKNMEYSKNLYSLNLLGIYSTLKVINTLYVKEGKCVVRLIFQFAFIKFSVTLKTVRTNMH